MQLDWTVKCAKGGKGATTVAKAEQGTGMRLDGRMASRDDLQTVEESGRPCGP
jgi:hypothetical protein